MDVILFSEKAKAIWVLEQAWHAIFIKNNGTYVSVSVRLWTFQQLQ